MTIIKNGDDLNDYTTPGCYRSQGSADSTTMLNTPCTNSGFKLIVEYLGNYTQTMQTVKAIHEPYIYIRTKISLEAKWGAWKQINYSSI